MIITPPLGDHLSEVVDHEMIRARAWSSVEDCVSFASEAMKHGPSICAVHTLAEHKGRILLLRHMRREDFRVEWRLGEAPEGRSRIGEWNE